MDAAISLIADASCSEEPATDSACAAVSFKEAVI
jgi:hypothetical protein